MTRTPMLLLLLSAFLLPDARAQAPAMRPAPVRPPPVATPNFFPGTPAEPVHTPTGAGASHGSLAEPGKQVTRSENKRPLPDEYDPKKVPGVWNVDGAPVASVFPFRVLDIPLTVEHPQHKDFKGLEAHLCATVVSKMLPDDSEMTMLLMRLPRADRACFVAELFAHCTKATADLNAGNEAEEFRRVRDTHNLALVFRSSMCRDIDKDSTIWRLLPGARADFDASFSDALAKVRSGKQLPRRDDDDVH